MSASTYRQHQKKKPRRSQEFYSQASLPQVKLNTRVRLPPINAEIHGIYAHSNRRIHDDWSAENYDAERLNLRLPRVPRHSENPPAKPAVKNPHPERLGSFAKTPEFYFPRTAYSVLPPIGKSVSLVSSQQTLKEGGQKVDEKTPPVNKRDGQDANQTRKPSIHRTKDKSRASNRVPSARQVHSLHPSSRAHKNRRSHAVLDNTGDQAVGKSAHLSNISLIVNNEEKQQAVETEQGADGPSTTNVPRVEDLEKLELSKEAKAFFKTPHARRRRLATCTGIDPTLMTAVDIIRDILLRQAMEELCMMW